MAINVETAIDYNEVLFWSAKAKGFIQAFLTDAWTKNGEAFFSAILYPPPNAPETNPVTVKAAEVIPAEDLQRVRDEILRIETQQRAEAMLALAMEHH